VPSPSPLTYRLAPRLRSCPSRHRRWERQEDLQRFMGLPHQVSKTVRRPRAPKGFFSLYRGIGVSVASIIMPYRGVQFGLNDTIKYLNPWDKEASLRRLASKWVAAQFSVAFSHTLIPLSVAACRWSPRFLLRSAYTTRVRSTALARSSLMRELRPCSRVALVGIGSTFVLVLSCTVSSRVKRGAGGGEG
jgi:hypothetical protein